MKDVSIVNGVIREVGDSHGGAVASETMYNFIEFTDGQILKRITAPLGLDGKLRGAARSGEQISLHVWKLPDGLPYLLALKGQDGRTFATEMRGVDGLGSRMMTLIAFLGLGTFALPLFGLGLYFWWLGWKIWRGQKKTVQARDYVRSLPNAILL
jgi:hypothetical protein